MPTVEMKITLSGLFQYDDSIFDDLKLPEEADKETAVWTILENCNDFEIMYPDAEYIKQSIGYWSKAMQLPWTRMWAAIHEEYNPLHNFDRHEEVHEETSGDNTQTLNTTQTTNDTQTDSKTAYNVDAFKDTDKTTQSGTVGNTGTVGNAGSGERDMSTHLYGNIGVTTSQQMLKAELDIATELDFYKAVARQFAEKFCILVY